MSALQAARAHVLGLPIDSAYSWGLNRAIFYAAAKRGFKGGGSAAGRGAKHGAPSGSEGRQPSAEAETYHLGDELAFKAKGTKELLFTIGGKTQTKEDFERQVAARFQGRFKDAWEEAVDYVNHFERETLSSGTEFFSLVYRPKRDEFAARWTEMAEAGGKAPPTERPVVASRARAKKTVRAS
jgi:hypothetical protein